MLFRGQIVFLSGGVEGQADWLEDCSCLGAGALCPLSCWGTAGLPGSQPLCCSGTALCPEARLVGLLCPSCSAERCSTLGCCSFAYRGGRTLVMGTRVSLELAVVTLSGEQVVFQYQQ